MRLSEGESPALPEEEEAVVVEEPKLLVAMMGEREEKKRAEDGSRGLWSGGRKEGISEIWTGRGEEEDSERARDRARPAVSPFRFGGLSSTTDVLFAGSGDFRGGSFGGGSVADRVGWTTALAVLVPVLPLVLALGSLELGITDEGGTGLTGLVDSPPFPFPFSVFVRLRAPKENHLGRGGSASLVPATETINARRFAGTEVPGGWSGCMMGLDGAENDAALRGLTDLFPEPGGTGTVPSSSRCASARTAAAAAAMSLLALRGLLATIDSSRSMAGTEERRLLRLRLSTDDDVERRCRGMRYDDSRCSGDNLAGPCTLLLRRNSSSSPCSTSTSSLALSSCLFKNPLIFLSSATIVLASSNRLTLRFSISSWRLWYFVSRAVCECWREACSDSSEA